MMENKILLQSSSDSTLCEFEDFNSKTTLRDTLFHKCQVKGLVQCVKDYIGELKNGRRHKKCTKYLLSSLCDELELHNISVSIHEVKYCDGYKDIYFGKNCVVSFHLDGFPGLKFGIWWEYPNSLRAPIHTCGVLFVQTMQTNLEFKPSNSHIVCSLDVLTLPSGMTVDLLDLVTQLKYVQTGLITL